MKHLKYVSEIFIKTYEKTLEKSLKNICNIEMATPKINTLATCF
jgi:hypothetical protein